MNAVTKLRFAARAYNRVFEKESEQAVARFSGSVILDVRRSLLARVTEPARIGVRSSGTPLGSIGVRKQAARFSGGVILKKRSGVSFEKNGEAKMTTVTPSSWMEERLHQLTPILERLIASEPVAFDERLRGKLPAVQGIYAISLKDGVPGDYLRAGKADVSLRQRIYENHYMGDQWEICVSSSSRTKSAQD